MAEYTLSPLAALDLEDIAYYTTKLFGEAKSKKYAFEMFGTFQMLADFPNAGKDVAYIKARLRCYLVKEHAIYYQKFQQDVFIVRILGQRQDPTTHIGG